MQPLEISDPGLLPHVADTDREKRSIGHALDMVDYDIHRRVCTGPFRQVTHTHKFEMLPRFPDKQKQTSRNDDVFSIGLHDADDSELSTRWLVNAYVYKTYDLVHAMCPRQEQRPSSSKFKSWWAPECLYACVRVFVCT